MLITKAEYARQRGITPAAVNGAIKRGLITPINDKIDPAVANIQWLANRRRAPSIPKAKAPPLDPGERNLDAHAVWVTWQFAPAHLPSAIHNWLAPLRTATEIESGLLDLLRLFSECLNRPATDAPPADED